MEVTDKYEREQIIRDKYQEEKNVIKVSNRGMGYWVTFVDNNYINRDQNNRQETYPHLAVKDGDYCEVLNTLTDFTPSFYDKGIILSFGDGAEIIPEKEKLTLMKVIRKLENLSISHKHLLSKINSISKICNDNKVYESKFLHESNSGLTETEE